ncbi:bZIP transcription factor 27 [Elaeis guineensis]|uniref:BZIP transcription factor 27 n=1 Tax=Elaeis guineensis var. tenera TaxID=51953 RepID=A0A6J0PS75_ELAGV|nr:bZIP transcription factor 27 [Elaeis guineensis]
MEEVWMDISLSTLHQDLEAKPTSTTTPFRGIVLQDFLGGDFNDPPPVSPPLNDLPLPRFTGLSLNSGHLMVHPNSTNSNTNGTGASSAGPFAYCSKKRALEQQPEASFGHGNGADRRKKRMIKNRESAARSRARKQAYTYELQREVARLLDENRKLERMFEELRLEMEAQVPAKRTLQRASTAPF